MKDKSLPKLLITLVAISLLLLNRGKNFGAIIIIMLIVFGLTAIYKHRLATKGKHMKWAEVHEYIWTAKAGKNFTLPVLSG